MPDPSSATTGLQQDAAPHCCFIPDEDLPLFEAAKSAADVPDGAGCQNRAKYEIVDLEERHPELAVTHACAEHVGELFGHAGEGTWTEGEPERWEVRSL